MDAGLFEKARGDMPVPDDIKGIKKPIIGYFGVIDEWMDTELVVELASAYPEASIVLIGPAPIVPVGLQKLKGCPNVYLTGQKPHDALPGYLKAFDVCIIPFKINELTMSVNPVKLYEYLAGGKNVVSTAMPELEKYQDIIFIGRDHKDFIQKVNLALNSVPDGAKINAAVMENTWDRKAKAMAEIIQRSIDAHG